MIKTICSTALPAFVFVLLASCAAQPSSYLSDYTGVDAGYIVASVAIRQKKSYNTAYLQIRALPDLHHTWMGYTERNFLTPIKDREEDFNEKCEKGGVEIRRVKPGRYELFSVGTSNGSASIFSGDAFSIVFEVQPNQVVYLGSFTAILDFNLGFISPKVDEFYFNVTDQQARDLSIAIQKQPNIQSVDVKNLILKPNDSTGTVLRFDNHPDCL